MSNNPNSSDSFNKPRYAKIRELESNTQTSKKTYLAKDRATQQLAIVKEYEFASQSSSWAGVKAYKNQIEALSELKHPGIPAYLKCFTPRGGLGIIREYKEAKSLAEPRNFEPEEIKKIAINLLEILIYLQERETPIIHRNLKPENILIDEELNVFLTDFGLPIIDSKGTVKNSQAGSKGFMPREQSRNKELTKSTDLYSLAVSLICALSQTPSAKVNNLTAADGRFNIAGVIPNNISMDFVEWLEKMLQPYPTNRSPDAAAALEALKQLDISRSPLPICDLDFLAFKANKYGEKLVETVTITNRVPDTLLEGTWQMVSHPREPKNSRGLSKWISFNPRTFEKNKVECKITVDTSKLMANETYERDFLLETNSSATNPSLKIAVKTPPVLTDKLPQIYLILLFVAALAGGNFGGWICDGRLFKIISMEQGYMGLLLGLSFGIMGGFAAAFSLIPVLGSSVTFLTIFYFMPLPLYGDIELVIGYFIAIAICTFAGWIMRHNCRRSLTSGAFSSLLIAMMSPVGIISSLLAIFGISFGIALNGLVVFRPLLITILLTTGISLGIFLFVRHFKQVKKLAEYQMSLSRLVRP
ncbi:MAG: protein kinase [Cyanobacteriota bacterium]|nr:protein kinase [Cyanobacteriota bacterium]